MKHNLAEVLQRLYDSEINCGCCSFWDAGWSAWIGDDANGYKARVAELDSAAMVAEWLHRQAIRLYPKSVYAKKYGA